MEERRLRQCSWMHPEADGRVPSGVNAPNILEGVEIEFFDGWYVKRLRCPLTSQPGLAELSHPCRRRYPQGRGVREYG
jgi:hypothetical protein